MDKLNKLNNSMNEQWHYHPKLPVGFYPFFDWPPSPKKWLSFIWHYWLQKSDRTIFLILGLRFYLMRTSFRTFMS